MTQFTLKELDDKLNPPEWIEQESQSAKTDLKFLCRDLLGMNDWDECHDRLMEWRYIHRDRRFKMFLMPRGFLKSSILTIGSTIQNILNDPNTRILLSSAIAENAASFLSEIKEYLTTKSTLPLLFGDFANYDKGWNASEITIRQRTKPNKTPTVDTAGINKTLTSQHYRIIRADDLVTRETITTAEQIQKVINHIKDLLKLLDPDGIMHIIGTRWDDQDSYQWVLNELTREELGNEAFVVYNMAPVCDASGKSIYIMGDKYPATAIPIFPKKFSIPVLENLKRKLGSYEYSTNMENNPTSPTNRIFQPPFRYWDSLPEEVAHIITVDPAISKRDDSCDAVVIDTAESRAGQFFAVDYTAFKGEDKHPSRIIDRIVEYHLRYGTPVCGIEAVGYQEVLCTLLIDELKKRGLKMEVVPIHQNEDKARRIICMQPYWERGDLLLKRGQAELEDQLEKFRKPIVAACDILDAFAMRWQVPDEFKVFKSAKAKQWSHPRYQVDPRLKNPYEGRALPSKDWNELQSRRQFQR